MATDSYLKSEMGSIMYTSFGREKPEWPGSEAWPLLFPNCVNLGKLFFLSELSLLCEMVIIIRPTFKVVVKVR